MSQLVTLIHLKWMLFRNSLRTSKAVVNRVASLIAMAAALALSLLIALGLGAAAYALTSPAFDLQALQTPKGTRIIPSAEFVFFSILAMIYLLWATLPLSIGATRQFDPGNLLLYPISFRKLFAIDFLSEVASLQSLFAVPAILAIGIGAGLATGNLSAALIISLVSIVFGVALAKWVSASIGSLIRKKQSRGETLLALFGVILGLGGVVFAQVAPVILRNAESVTALRWTPPGALAFALANGLRATTSTGLVLALALIIGYTLLLILTTYWLAHRAVLGGGKRRRREVKVQTEAAKIHRGWQLPFVSPLVSAVVEKELRYAGRNAQLRMMAAMPLILIVVRLMNQRRFGARETGNGELVTGFLYYGEGLIATGGLLYVFLILTGISCNLFAFEHAGMRTLVLSPADRKVILQGKNIAATFLALLLSAALLGVNQAVFGDLSVRSLLFAALSFVIYAALISVIGNWLSIRFPKRMKIGKRQNVSGVVGLLLIPMIVLLALPPIASVAIGYVAQSLLVEYVTLAVLAALSIGLYAVLIGSQGEMLQRRELEILEAVNDPGND